uniref:ornithine decarboxylase n=1 Tax=Leersia perrieri TaxID=77586 RepID=A0A0D9XG79_9ORYZ
MVGGSPMQAVLTAPGIKDKKILPFNRDVTSLKHNHAAAVTSLIRDIIVSGAGDAAPPPRSAFHVFDLARIVDLYRSWRRAMPRVRPYYAVKCNPDATLLTALAALGAGFDCASAAEIESVLAIGVDPEHDVVYANPCKPDHHLEFAAAAGVDLTTFDSADEIPKIKRLHPRCRLLLRIKAPCSGGDDVKVDLGLKYGANADEVVPLLLAARREGVHVAGVSFHVGSGASNADVYRGAVEAARKAFDAAAALGMAPMSVLDVGGGFVAGGKTFDDAADVINESLDCYFGDLLSNIEVIGEPGRYFAETAFTLATRVIGKRVRGELREYWIDDGLYGSLNCVIMDHYVPRPRPLLLVAGEVAATTHVSTVFGPTCDSLDTVVTGYQLPEMSVGDWLVFDDMGAYTTAAGSKFNGFDTSAIKIYLAYST